MANKVLRPSGPSFGRYNTAWGVSPASFYWQAIDDVVEDGDTSYLYTDSPNAAFTVRFSTYDSIGFPRSTRVEGLLVVATIRINPFGYVDYSMRIRCAGTDYDTDVRTLTNASYVEVYAWYPQIPNGAAWNSATLSTIEAGLVYLAGDAQLRCTKLEMHVIDDAIPDLRLDPVVGGSLSQWLVQPSTSTDYDVLGGPWDGDVSYIYTDQSGFKTRVAHVPMDPTTLNIEKVLVTTAARTTLLPAMVQPEVKPILRSGGVDFSSGINSASTLLPFVTDKNEYAWTLAVAEFYKDPNLGWPDSYLGGPWTMAAVNAAEMGIEAVAAAACRCTKVAMDVVLHPTPTSTFDLLPVSDSALARFHTIPGVAPVKAYPNIWENVDEDPPDDAGSYIGADASVLGTPAYGVFGVGPAPVIPPGEQLWAVQSSCRLQLGSTSTALVALCVNDASNELIVGPVKTLFGTGATWFNLYHTWYTNPITGQPWQPGEPETLEWGVVILDGEAQFSQVKVQVWTSPEWTAATDVSAFELTDQADFFINRSISDGTIYAVTSFGVGTGGYNPTTLVNVLPVVKADTALVNQVYQGPVGKVTFEDGSPQKVTYWCRAPRGALVGNSVGEIGLYATILWSPLPIEIGSEFLWGIAHMPAQAMTENDIGLYKLTVEYP